MLGRYFKKQGFNFSECAPTICANIINLSRKAFVTDRHKLRLLNKKGSNFIGWWSISDISKCLSRNKVDNVLTDVRKPDKGQIAIYHVNGIHFVSVENNNGLLLKYDTLFFSVNPSAIDFRTFIKSITYSKCVIVNA